MVKNIKVIITEKQLKSAKEVLINQNEDDFNPEENIKRLILSGQEDNIRLAIEIADGMGINYRELVKPVELLTYVVRPPMMPYRNGDYVDFIMRLLNSPRIEISYTSPKIDYAQLLHLKKISDITLFNLYLKEIPDEIFAIESLKHLYIKACSDITTISPKIKQLHNLKTLSITGVRLTKFPVALEGMNLNRIDLRDSKIPIEDLQKSLPKLPPTLRTIEIGEATTEEAKTLETLIPSGCRLLYNEQRVIREIHGK